MGTILTHADGVLSRTRHRWTVPVARGGTVRAMIDAASDAERAEAAERLRRRYPPPRVPRPVAVAALAVVAALFVTGVVLLGLSQSTPPVSGRVTSFRIVSDTQADYVLTVQRPDPSLPVTCRVIAQSVDFETVGSVQVAVPPRPEAQVNVSESMRTFRRATSVSVDRCQTAQ